MGTRRRGGSAGGAAGPSCGRSPGPKAWCRCETVGVVGFAPSRRIAEDRTPAVSWRPARGSRGGAARRRPGRNASGLTPAPADRRGGIASRGIVVAGVERRPDVEITGPPLSRGDQPLDHAPQLGGGDGGGVAPGARRTASSGAVHELRPGSNATTTEYGQPGIMIAWSLPYGRRCGTESARATCVLPGVASTSHPLPRQAPIRGAGHRCRRPQARRSRSIINRPCFNAAYIAP